MYYDDSYMDDYLSVFDEDDMFDIEFEPVFEDEDFEAQRDRMPPQRRPDERDRFDFLLERPAPRYIPRRPFARRNIRSIQRCVGRFTFLWLFNGRSFWAIITRVRRRSVEGFRWNGRRWVNFQVDFNEIDTFICI